MTELLYWVAGLGFTGAGVGIAVTLFGPAFVVAVAKNVLTAALDLVSYVLGKALSGVLWITQRGDAVLALGLCISIAFGVGRYVNVSPRERPSVVETRKSPAVRKRPATPQQQHTSAWRDLACNMLASC